MTETAETLTLAEIAARARRSERTIARWKTQPGFPKPVQLPHVDRLVFSAADIEAYLQSRRAA